MKITGKSFAFHLKTKNQRAVPFPRAPILFQKKRGMAAPGLSRHSLGRRIVAAGTFEKMDDHFVIID